MLPFSGTANVAGISFNVTNGTSGGTAIKGDGGATGVLGSSPFGTGHGVFGRNDATTGSGFGVYGTSASDDGIGVYGYALGTDYSFGGRFKSAGTDPYSAGVLAEGYSAVFGIGSRYGAKFSTFGTNGFTGVEGSCTGSNLATTYGGLFTSDTQQGTAVRGAATSTFGANFGGFFSTDSSSSTAVKGQQRLVRHFLRKLLHD